MKSLKIILGVFLINISLIASSQVSNTDIDNSLIHGFVRGGIYTGVDKETGGDNKPYFSSAFSDIGLKLKMENGLNYKAYADLRFRFGAEFKNPVTNFDIREAYIKINGKKWDFSAGQTIIKWGRADFTNPTSKLSPKNMIYRSPDREDIDMGNLLADINWYPSSIFTTEIVLVPYYRPSVLMIDQIKLPENVKINKIGTLITDKKMFSWGLKTSIHGNGIDGSLSWFDGYDPMPGIALTSFSLDLSGAFPVALTELTLTPYKTRVLGLDFETSTGNTGIRGEVALTKPYLSYKTNEYVPMTDIKWVTGFDWSLGIFQITGEYYGKSIPDFTSSEVDPALSTEPDYTRLAALFLIPGFNPEEFTRLQVGAFNRLYNYQLKQFYHSAAIKIDADLMYGMVAPTVLTIYNFNTHDLLVIPEVKLKPYDGLTISFGGEYYSGTKGSLYDLVEGFMNSVYGSIRVDF
jgi:hypothetical protein